MAQLQACAIVMLIALWYYMERGDSQWTVRGAVFRRIDHSLVVSRLDSGEQGAPVLAGNLGLDFPLHPLVTSCSSKTSGSSVCAEWKGMAKFMMDYEEDGETRCYNITWEAQSKDHVPLDCFNLSGTHWYGGAERYSDRWPIQLEPTSLQQYMSNDTGRRHNLYGSVMHRYWFSSAGVAIVADDDVPLHVGINSSNLCLKADYQDSKYPNPHDLLPSLKYTICVGKNVKQVHQYVASKFFAKPIGTPDDRVFEKPIWSTWAKYKVNITQDKVLEFANDIKDRRFEACQIEIDDMYTPTYGDFTFDRKKFPDPKSMSDYIHEKLGFKITSWVIPFANLDSQAFKVGSKKGYFVKDQNGEVPGLVKWWQGFGALLDVTNPEAVSWYFKDLGNLQESGVDSFKFDAGEVNYLPPGFTTFKSLPNPSHYSSLYAEAASEHSDRLIEVRVGYRTQHLPNLVRMMDKDSTWDYEGGLKTLIPTALIFGVLGYPFVLPDMIGGNAYGHGGIFGDLPEKELFIRWMEVNIFLPAMQFSIAPWQYDKETVDITRKMMALRDSYVVPKILALAKDSMNTGFPIIRPLWWADPEDGNTFDVDSQFLVGDDVLVAPILDKGETTRDIYLPKGTWQDMLSKDVIKGPRFLKVYKIALDEIAYFERMSD